MPNYTTTPYMGLTEPTVGLQPSPTWAQDLNANFTAIDSHDHTPGKGVPITTAGLSIDADLSFNDYNATDLRSTRYTPISLASLTGDDVGCIVVSGVDLYYVDVDGNQIQITNNGAVAGTPGSIAGLVPPASATYVPASSKFTWQSDVNVAADMDGGSVTIREKIANAKGITLQSPTSLAANYALTFPTALPASNSIMMMSSGGVLTAPTNPDITQATIRTLVTGGTGGADGTPLEVNAGTSTGVVRQRFYNAGATKSFLLTANFLADAFGIQSDLGDILTFERATGDATFTGKVKIGGSPVLAKHSSTAGLVLTNSSAGFYPDGEGNASLVGGGSKGIAVASTGGTALGAMVSGDATTPWQEITGVIQMDFGANTIGLVTGSGGFSATPYMSGGTLIGFTITFTNPFLTAPAVFFTTQGDGFGGSADYLANPTNTAFTLNITGTGVHRFAFKASGVRNI